MTTHPKITRLGGERHHSSARHPLTPAIQPPTAFAMEDHLWVESETRKRAHRFWLANGCAENRALSDWLKAENEVLAEFVRIRMPSLVTRPAPSDSRGSAVTAPAARANPHQQVACEFIRTVFQYESGTVTSQSGDCPGKAGPSPPRAARNKLEETAGKAATNGKKAIMKNCYL
jgi:hypothetical protein